MNLHLHLVVSDLHGETGMRIIEAIVAGQREAQELVKLRDPRCHKSTVEEMEAGLKGTYDEEQLFVLEQALKAWKFYQEQMAQCDLRIEKVLNSARILNPHRAWHQRRMAKPHHRSRG